MIKHKKSVLFFPVNGSGLGHVSRCIAYARHLPADWNINFFTLSMAVPYIEKMGYGCDYFISPLISNNTKEDWNKELEIRFLMMLQQTNPDILVFDGTWPFQGMRKICTIWKKPIKKVWSRGILKQEAKNVTVPETSFDLVICPGELYVQDAEYTDLGCSTKKITVPPVVMYKPDEMLSKADARNILNLPQDKRLVLFMLGPGNLKNVDDIGYKLMNGLMKKGFIPIWLQSPISIKEMNIPSYAISIKAYPLAPYMHAFDGIVSAAGYSSCCEIAQAGIPALLVPNDLVKDDQYVRARYMTSICPATVCRDERNETIEKSIYEFLELKYQNSCHFDGANIACKIIKELID